MEKEFRRYDKINCSLFDLISGDLEPKQTMALGYLLANSEAALKVLLKCVNIKVKKYDKYIVNCEAQTKQQNNNGRIDILILFYKSYKLVRAIIIEAKSVSANSNSNNAQNQLKKYANGFKNETKVSLTRNAVTFVNGNIVSLSWSKLISMLHNKAKPKNKDVHERERELINNFINFIINIKGSMEYYEEEILSIAAGKTIEAIEASGIYECPINYKDKKNLYM